MGALRRRVRRYAEGGDVPPAAPQDDNAVYQGALSGAGQQEKPDAEGALANLGPAVLGSPDDIKGALASATSSSKASRDRQLYLIQQAMGRLPSPGSYGVNLPLMAFATGLGARGGGFNQGFENLRDQTMWQAQNDQNRASAMNNLGLTEGQTGVDASKDQWDILKERLGLGERATQYQEQIAQRRDAAGLAAQYHQAEVARQRDADQLRREIFEDRLAAKTDKFDKPVLAEADDPNGGERSQILAQQDKNTGQWVTADEARTPLKNIMLPGGIPGGGRSAAQISRIITAAKDAATGLSNVAALPVTATTSIFGGQGQTLSLWQATKQYLGNALTPQEVQDANTSFVGIGKALGTLDAGGLQTSDTFMKQLDKLQLQPGDTNFTKMRKLAEIRQMADNSLESQLNGPLLSPDQKKYAKQLRKDLEVAVPWTPSDVTKLQQSKKPTATLRDYAKGIGLQEQSPSGPASSQAPVPAGPAAANAVPSSTTPSIPPGVPTATGPNGEKIYWNGTAWVPVPVR